MVTQQYVVAVVDDDPGMRDSMESLITAFGLYAEVYASGEGFLKAAAESEAACLVVDIELEDMTGIDLVRQLMKIGFEFPIIFMTGSDDEGLRRVAEGLSIVAYLRKPFPAVQLMKAIEKVIGGKFLSG
jgi:FixJ family two-component response regulator